jgi:hypothetical protein
MPQHLGEVLVIKDRLAQPSSWTTSFPLPHDSLGVGERGSGQVNTQLHQLIGPISPVFDRYVQYLLMGTNPSVLNRHRWGLSHINLRIATSLSPPFPSDCSTSPPKWLCSVSSLSEIYQLNQSLTFKGTYGHHVVFRPLGHLP